MSPELTLDAPALLTIYPRGSRFWPLHRAGRVDEHRDGALAEADELFAVDRAHFSGVRVLRGGVHRDIDQVCASRNESSQASRLSCHGATIPRADRSDLFRFEELVASARRPAGRSPQRSHSAPGRRGVRPVRRVRFRHCHANIRPSGVGGAALRQFPHDRSVLTDPGVSAHWTKPSLKWHGPGRRARIRLSGLQRNHSKGEWLPLRDTPLKWVRHLRRRKMAPDTSDRNGGGQPTRQMASRARL